MKSLSWKLILLSVIFGLIFWLVDAVVDCFPYYGGTFWDLVLFQVPPHELYIRSSIVIVSIVFGMLLSWVVQSNEKKQEENEQKYRTALASIGDVVIATDRDGYIIMMNPVAERLTGWNFAKAQGQPLRQVFLLVDEDTRMLLECPVTSVLNNEEVFKFDGVANKAVLIADDGAEHPITNSCSPIYNDDGEIDGAVLVFRLHTREREVQRALVNAKDYAENLI